MFDVINIAFSPVLCLVNKADDVMKCGMYFNAVFLPLSFSLPLQSSWVISVELAIGPEEGISYLTDKGSMVSTQIDDSPHKVNFAINQSLVKV